MNFTTLACARCTTGNHLATRFCTGCGLPLGSAQADAGAGLDALGPYEAPDPGDAGVDRLVRAAVMQSGFESTPHGPGWRMVVPLPLDRKQAVYFGPTSSDRDGRPIVSLVSICGTANDRDPRILLKGNARVVDGHFAIKTLRGEDYFVVVRNLTTESLAHLDFARLVGRIAEAADDLEDRLTRGRDLF